MPYEVQLYTAHRVWMNACVYDEGDGPQGETFATREEAQAALDELVVDIVADKAAGFRPPWCLEHFRIHYESESNGSSAQHLAPEVILENDCNNS